MRVVIIGAGYAGLSCALRLSGRAPRDTQITLVDAASHFVERIRLHEQAAGKRAPAQALAAMVRGTSVSCRTGWVERIDLAARTAWVDGEALTWDRLVLALGSHVDVDAVPGVREHAYTLDAPAMSWLAALVPSIAQKRGHVVIVGGGLTGIEAATELAETLPTLSVTLVTRGALAPGFTNRARAHAEHTLARLGVRLRMHCAVERLAQGQLLTDQGPIDFDACIWATGFRAPPLASEAGLAVNARGQVWVDAALRATEHPDVYVAGDLHALREPLAVAVPMGCKAAFPTAFHVAENLARDLRGAALVPFTYATLPYCVSLGRRDALVQLPGGRVVTGAFAATIKELICRGTQWALALERRRAALSGMLRIGRTPVLLPLSSTDGEPS